MAITVMGTVSNGVVIPAFPLPEGAQVEVSVKPEPSATAAQGKYLTASELLELPPAEREPYLAAAAALAKKDYLEDKDLTGFAAFSEELDDDNSDEG